MSIRTGRPTIAAEDRKTATFTVVATEGLKRAVEAEARTQDRTVGADVRRALVDYLKGTEDVINE